MNRFFFFLTALLCQVILSSQVDLDSIRERADAFALSKQYDSAIHTYEEGLRLARDKNDYTSEGFFLIDIGYVYLRQNNLKEAQESFDKSKTVGEEAGDLRIQATSYLNLGIIMAERAVYLKGSEYLIKSIEFFEKISDMEGLASAYNSLAALKQHQGKLREALEDNRKALDIRKQLVPEDSSMMIDFLTDIASSLNNIGEVYKDAGQYDSARYYLNLALIKKQRLSDSSLQASTLTALAEIYRIEKKYILAIANYWKAYKLRKQYGDRVGIANSANRIAGLLLEQDQNSDVNAYINEALYIALTDSINDELLISYDLKRRLFRIKHEADSALWYDDLYIKQSRVVFNEKARRAIEDMEAKYESDKKDQQLTISNERARFYMWMVLAVLFTTGISLYAYYRKRKDNRKLELARKNAEEAKDQIEILWKELNHRVKNNLQTLSSILSIQRTHIRDEMIKKVFRDVENRARAMSVMHRKLYINKSLTLISMDTLIYDLVEDLRVTFGKEDVKLNINLEQVNMHADKAIPMGLIVNELLTNAFKYAFKEQPVPQLEIRLFMEGKATTLIISDNGPGIIEGKQDDPNSFGFTLIRLFTKQLGGTFISENREGLYTSLIL